MQNIEIKEEKQTENGWRFIVQIDEENSKSQHSVTIDNEYWKILTNSRHNVGELTRKSFEFLLSKEPKESILPEFNLAQIKSYFPDYEEKIKEQMP